jgi:hypothetical protein
MLFDKKWSSNWDMRTPGGTVRYLRGYTKTSYGICKIGGKKILFHDKHRIMRARFWVSHRIIDCV